MHDKKPLNRRKRPWVYMRRKFIKMHGQRGKTCESNFPRPKTCNIMLEEKRKGIMFHNKMKRKAKSEMAMEREDDGDLRLLEALAVT